MVVAPEYPGLDALTVEAQRPAVAAYVAAASTKSDLERTELAKSKTGVFTGEATAGFTVHDLNCKVPVFREDLIRI